jgi:hypothetical protein
MRTVFIARLLAGLAVVAAPMVHADTIDFAGTFAGIGAVDLQFTTDSATNTFGGNDVLSITGSVGSFGAVDQQVTAGFVAPEPTVNVQFNASSGYTAVFSNGTGLNLTGDNTYLSTSGQSFDDNGLLLQLTNGDYVDIWGDGGSNYTVAIGSPTVGAGVYPLVGSSEAIATVAPVPLPAAAFLLLSGLGGFGVSTRKRQS